MQLNLKNLLILTILFLTIILFIKNNILHKHINKTENYNLPIWKGENVSSWQHRKNKKYYYLEADKIESYNNKKFNMKTIYGIIQDTKQLLLTKSDNTVLENNFLILNGNSKIKLIKNKKILLSSETINIHLNKNSITAYKNAHLSRENFLLKANYIKIEENIIDAQNKVVTTYEK